jgi:amino acid adenylation domain-containing protein
LLQAQAARTPERVALRFGETVLSYAELDARSQRIAAALRGRGVGPGALVGVCLERGPDLVATLIGVLKAGAAYVPLDPAYPAERLRCIAEDAALAQVVAEADLAQPLAWPRERLLLLDADHVEIDAGLDTAATDALAVSAGADADALAYVIYTSGSTGQPKGVRIPHRAVLNFLASMQREPGLGRDDRLLAVTTTAFDIAVLELFLPLSVGAELVLASREQAGDGHALAELLTGSDATVMQATPSTWRMLFEAGWQGAPRLRALVGGEALPPELAAQLCAGCAEVWNLYGPTETTVWSTCWKVAQPEAGISIGRPIANTTIEVFDERGQRCPIGVPGELWIGGAGVALGYHHRPELDAERFVAEPGLARPDASSPVARLYRTGDRGRWRADGTLEHLGRLDFQVKVRGHRIELGEIEVRLAADPAVAGAVALAREDRPGDVRLVGYLVARPGAHIDIADLRERLKSALPGYMLPQHLVVLEALPLLPNGKLDRNALPAPAGDPASGFAVDEDEDARDPRVAYLAEVWADLLGTAVAPGDNFFDLGGHSMLAVQMANRVARDTGARIKLVRLATQSLAQVAASLPVPDTAAAVEAVGGGILRNVMRLLGLAAAERKP